MPSFLSICGFFTHRRGTFLVCKIMHILTCVSSDRTIWLPPHHHIHMHLPNAFNFQLEHQTSSAVTMTGLGYYWQEPRDSNPMTLQFWRLPCYRYTKLLYGGKPRCRSPYHPWYHPFSRRSCEPSQLTFHMVVTQGFEPRLYAS